MDDLLELTKYRQTTIDGNKTMHRRYQGQYEVWMKTKELGSGAFGSVWLERNESGSQSRAVKRVVTRGSQLDYRKEIIALAQLRRFEDHFVYFHGWYEGPDSIYLAMDYFPLGDLSRHLNPKKRIPEDQIRRIAQQLLTGLQAMHSIGFCHRDLKPLNIFVVKAKPDWAVRIGDFGIAKRVVDETRLKTAIGTPAYMAPEMFPYLIDDEESHPYTEAVDIWALGSVVYQLFTLQTPFGSHNPLSRFVRGKTSFPIADLESAEVSTDGKDFLEALLQPLPEDRPSATAALGLGWLRDVVAPAQSPQSVEINMPLGSNASRDVNFLDVASSVQLSTFDSVPEASVPWSTVHVPAESSTMMKKRPVDWRRYKQCVGYNDNVMSVAFHPNAELIASGSMDGTVRIWNMAGKEIKSFKPGRIVYKVAVSEHGLLASQPLTNNGEELLTLWDIESGQLVRSFRIRYGLSNIEFLPQSTLLALAPSSGVVQLVDVASGSLVNSFTHPERVYSVACSPDGRYLASKSLCTLKIWDVRTGKAVKSERFMGGGRAMSFSPDGSFVALANSNETVLWDIGEEREVGHLRGHTKSIFSLSFSPDGKLIASGGQDRTIRVWDLKDKSEIQQLEGHEKTVRSVAFSPNGRVLASGGDGGIVRLWGDI